MRKAFVLLLAAAAAFAADEAKDPNAFVTHTELSYVNTQGNTDTNAFSFDFAGKKAWGAHSLKLDADMLYGTEDQVENKNKFFSELNYDWQFAKHFTVNYLAGYKNDKFSGFDYQFYTGPGFKYIALKGDTHNLDFQANALFNVDQGMNKYYTDANLTDEVEYPYPNGKDGLYEAEGEYEDYWGYMLRGNYSWVIVKGFKFIQEASYRGDFEDEKRYFVYSKSALESKINSYFSMGISYKVDYTNLPPAGNERTDRTFMTSLIIDY